VDWIKGVQEVAPWLTSLPLVPKTIISVLIVGAAAFVLVLIWTPPPEIAVKAILADCYRRALFTRMHAQINTDAMFASIGRCREILQKKIPEIHRKDLQDTAVELLATVEQIERRKPIQGSNDIEQINKLKLAALHSFRVLATATGGRYPLPERGKLGEAAYFTKEEADAPLSPDDLRQQLVINPATGETDFSSAR
jgi:hypothetical protein